MPFYLRRDARDWFSELTRSKQTGRGFALDFDMYYLCAVAGLAASKKASVPENVTELVDDFPGEYRQKGRLIVAMFLARECKRRRIRLDDRQKLHDTIRDLVDPNSSPWLSSEGMKLMNEYAAGGLEVLMEASAGHKPQHIETFLPNYLKQIDAVFVDR